MSIWHWLCWTSWRAKKRTFTSVSEHRKTNGSPMLNGVDDQVMEHLNKLDWQIHGTCWDVLMNAWGWWSMSLWGQFIIFERLWWSEGVPQDWRKTNDFTPALSDQENRTQELQLAIPWSSGKWSEKILEAVYKYTKGKNVIWSNPCGF